MNNASLVLRPSLWIAAALLAGYGGWLAMRIGAPLSLLSTGMTVLLFALPGLFLGTALFGRKFSKNPESLIFGSVLGLALSGFVALAVGYLVAWSVGIVSASLLLLTLVCALVSRRYWNRPLLASRLRDWETSDYAVLLGMFAALLGFVTLPYLNIGRLTPEGYAYTWLFGFDFLLRSAIAVSVTHGLPPNYLHLAGESLRIYLVAYTLPALAYSASAKSASIHSIVLLTQLATSLLFLACLYSYLRCHIRSRRALLWTAVIAMAGYSYYGWYVIAKLLARGFPSVFGFLQLDRLGQFGDVSHLFQRLFLVEPQALMGLCVFLFFLLVLEISEYRVTSYGVAMILGLALGIEFGIEGWQGLALASWFACVMFWRWAQAPRKFLPEYGPLFVALALCVLVYTSYFALGVYGFSSGKAISIRPFWWAILLSPLYFPAEYGPMFLLAVWALWWGFRRGRGKISVPLMILAGLTLLQVFFVTARVLPEFGLLRGNRILPLILLVWTGSFLDDFFRREQGRWVRLLPAVLVLAAFPTVLTDIYVTSNIKDTANTRYVRPADLTACAWIRRNLPESAIVQSEPDYVGQSQLPARHGAVELSLIADFAERPMAIGEYWIASTIIQDSEGIAKTRYRDVRRMFLATDVSLIAAVVQKYKIDYLYVGTYEQQLYPQFLGLLWSDPVRFAQVYAEHGVHIFKCGGSKRDVVSRNSRQTRLQVDGR